MINYVQQLDLIGDRGHKAKVVLKSGEVVVGEPWYIDTDYVDDEDTIVIITADRENFFDTEKCINSEIESIEEIIE